jgi:predicted nucleic acid-binding protein
VARQHRLVAALRRDGGFVSDTAPLVYRFERSAPGGVLEAVDALFDEVERGGLGCLVSTLVAAELLVRPYRVRPAAAAVVDGFLRAPHIGVAEPTLGVAHGAARLVAKRVLPRLGDAIVAATASEVGSGSSPPIGGWRARSAGSSVNRQRKEPAAARTTMRACGRLTTVRFSSRRAISRATSPART